MACRVEGQVTNMMCAIVCLYTDRLRKTPGSVTAHLGDGIVDDLYLLFASLHLSLSFFFLLQISSVKSDTLHCLPDLWVFLQSVSGVAEDLTSSS